MDKNYYIKKWLDGSLTDEELKAFKESKDYQSLERLSNAVQAFKAPEYDVKSELEKLQSNRPEKGKVVSINWLRPLIRVAAVLVTVVAAFFYFYINQETSVETLASEKSELFLPDSSRVAINALSKVSYKKNRWNSQRRVKLDGEAYFDVAKGSKFDVVTASGVVSVLGTQFNVINRDKYFEVVCFEGLVQVQSGSEVAQLPPNHSFQLIDGKVIKKDDSDERSPGWLENESSFRSVPFFHVIREFERQYSVTVNTKNVDLDVLYTGTFVHDDRALALKSISLPLNLNYEIRNENLIILSEGGD